MIAFGVGVIDETEGNDGMEDGLDRRIKGFRVEHGGTLVLDHVRIGKFRHLRHLQQGSHAHRSKPGFLDRGEVPATPLYVEDIDAVPEKSVSRIFTEVLPPRAKPVPDPLPEAWKCRPVLPTHRKSRRPPFRSNVNAWRMMAANGPVSRAKSHEPIKWVQYIGPVKVS